MSGSEHVVQLGYYACAYGIHMHIELKIAKIEHHYTSAII